MVVDRETPASHRQPRLSRICVDPLMTVILLGLLVGLVIPNIPHRPTRAAVRALALMAVRLCCLTLAKSSLWRQALRTPWGAAGMTKGAAILSRGGRWGTGPGVLL